jgi:diguanylate cyclase (GGDEF)-like protein
MDWHQKRRIITILFATGIAVLIALAVGSMAISARAFQASAALASTTDQVEDSTGLHEAIDDLETGLHGYLRGGDLIFLDSYYRGRHRIGEIQKQMDPAINDWTAPDQPDQPFGQGIAQILQMAAAVVDRARAHDLSGAQAQFNSGGVQALLDNARAIIMSGLDVAAERVDADEERVGFLAKLNAVLVVSTLTLAVLFSAAQFILFRSEVQRRGGVELKLRHRNEERRQISKLSSALQLSDSRREAFAIIEAYAGRIMGELSGALYVYAASRDQLMLVSQWQAPEAAQRFADQIHPSECWSLRQGGQHTGCAEPAGLRAGDAAPINCRHIEGEIGPYSCIPIVGRGQILAMLHLRGEAFRNAGAAPSLNGRIERLTDQLSLSLTNIDLREKLENMALRDELTGLYNRRFLDEMLDHSLAKLKRDGKQAALLLLDVDHFKRFNDKHGHQAGDEALRRVASALAASVRASDVVCRYGGEEFLVFLPECDLAEAMAKAEKIRSTIASTSFRFGDQTIPPVTASIGVAMFPETGLSREQLIRMSDRALYQAKGAGRNRVAVAKPEAPAEAAAGASTQAAK